MIGSADTPHSILYVIGSLDVGGAEGHLAAITPRLADRGWDVAIYCLERRGVLAAQVAGGGVRVLAPPVEKREARGIWRRAPIRLPLAALRLALSALKLGWLMRRHRPEIVHFFLPGAYLIGGPLALWARVPVRIMSRRCRNHYQARHAIAARIEHALHGRMTALIGNSRRLVDDLVEEGAAAERIGLIHNGVDLTRFGTGDVEARRPAGRAALGLAPDALVFVTIANLIPYKGHGDLIDALAGVAHALPGPWALLCVGRDNGCGAELVRRAEARGLKERVHFLGCRRDVPELLALSDIGVLASHEEGFSNAVLEGMAAGLPMVVTDVGGNAEAVANGETGLVVPPRDPAGLGKALAALAVAPERRRAMGAAGRIRVETGFSLEACVAKYEALYKELVGGELGGGFGGGLGGGLGGGKQTRDIAALSWNTKRTGESLVYPSINAENQYLRKNA